MTIDNEALMKKAKAVRNQAHAPYSRYYVGSAVLDENGEVHLGCNVENTAFPQGSCAEANAIGAMVAAGGRRIAKIAVAGGSRTAVEANNDLEVCTPCGGCRQRIFEFSDESTEIISLDGRGRVITHSIGELLPASIKPV